MLLAASVPTGGVSAFDHHSTDLERTSLVALKALELYMLTTTDWDLAHVFEALARKSCTDVFSDLLNHLR